MSSRAEFIHKKCELYLAFLALHQEEVKDSDCPLMAALLHDPDIRAVLDKAR